MLKGEGKVMMGGIRIGLALAALTVLGFTCQATAGVGLVRATPLAGVHATSPVEQVTHRRKPQVRGWVRRGGYYSYRPEESINAYGNTRTNYGSADVYRNPTLDQQTRFGPFDHDFFFDSGISTPYGGNSTYNH